MFAGQIMPRAAARTHGVQASPPRAGRQIIGDAICVSGTSHPDRCTSRSQNLSMTARTTSTYPCAQPAGLGQPGASWAAPTYGVVGDACRSEGHAFGGFGQVVIERAGRKQIGTTSSAGSAGGGRT